MFISEDSACDAIDERDCDLDPWNDDEHKHGDAGGEHAEGEHFISIDAHCSIASIEMSDHGNAPAFAHVSNHKPAHVAEPLKLRTSCRINMRSHTAETDTPGAARQL
jgi:hypothetical protein